MPVQKVTKEHLLGELITHHYMRMQNTRPNYDQEN
jgi:hypothetical protein